MAPPAANSKLFARASLFVIGLAWTLPFLQPFHRLPVAGFYSEWLAIALGMAAALLLLCSQPWREAEMPVVAIAPIGLIVVLGLQVLLEFGPYAEQVLTAVLYLMWALLLILLGHVLKRELTLPAVATTLAWFLLVGGALSAAIGILQHYHVLAVAGIPILQKVGPEIYGNLGQANHFATYLAMAQACAVYLFGRGRLRVSWFVASAVVLLPPLAMSGSRSPWLYLIALAILASLLYQRVRNAESRRLAIVTLMLLPGFAIAQLVLLIPVAAPDHVGQITSADRMFHVASGLERRLQLWWESWQMFLDAPLLGAGYGQFAWHHFLATASNAGSVAPDVFNHSHNIVLQLLAETGAIGTGIVVAPLLLWLVDLRRCMFVAERWWLLALTAVIGIHSMLEHPLWYSYFLGMAALILGSGAERNFLLRNSDVVRAMVALAIIIGWLNVATVLPPYREFERLVFAPVRGTAKQVDEESFARAISRLYREPLLVPYVDLAVAINVTVSEDNLKDKLLLTARAVRFIPLPAACYRYALLLALAGEREAALVQLDRSLRAYPAEVGDVVVQLDMLARSNPEVFAPMLELTRAVSKRSLGSR